jgi:hypothetical protein
MKFLELFYCATWREPWDFIAVKTCLCMFQLAPFMISTHECRLCGSCGTDKTCVFLRLVTKRVIGFYINEPTLNFVWNYHWRWNMALSGANIFLNTLFSETLSLYSSLKVRDQVSHPCSTTGKFSVLYILILYIYMRREDKRFWTE